MLASGEKEIFSLCPIVMRWPVFTLTLSLALTADTLNVPRPFTFSCFS